MARLQAAIVLLASLLATLLATVLAGCSDASTSGTGTAASTTVTTAATTPVPATTTSASRPPSTHATVSPLPGGKTIDHQLCTPAAADMRAETDAFHIALAKYPDSGRPIPAAAWADAAQHANGTYAAKPTEQRAGLIAAGAPQTHEAIRDIDDFLAAVADEKAVIQAKDESRVLDVWYRLDAATERFVQACGVLAPN